MFQSHINFEPASLQPIIEEALVELRERVFPCWLFPPTFLVNINPSEELDEVELRIEYENPNDPDNECEQGHEAMALACAFIEGVLFSKEIKGR
jgi:hypothetical protein